MVNVVSNDSYGSGQATLCVNPEAIDIHIYGSDKIEKHLPSNETTRVNYYYHDDEGHEIHIGSMNFVKTAWRQTSGAEQKKGHDGQYLDYCQLVDFRDLKEFSSGGVKFKIIEGALQSGRYYVDIEAFAVLIAAMIDNQITDLVCSGYSTSTGNTAGGSSSHLNGMIGDLGYFSRAQDGSSVHLFLREDPNRNMLPDFDYERQKKFIESLHHFGYSQYAGRKMLSEKFTMNNEETLLPYCQHYDAARHYHHLHIQGLKTSLIVVKSK